MADLLPPTEFSKSLLDDVQSHERAMGALLDSGWQKVGEQNQQMLQILGQTPWGKPRQVPPNGP